ncbi:hypothetical protein GH714_015140 [Hevea brasiliensis]|uniref:Beta-glucosidase n=1 Tax=Hevea brasiliensis TaxID=3981 RepID=A0A6A6N202_HEVBR|nr:hypothetical protein GH714_015140 [Hevea brasiliensis]
MLIFLVGLVALTEPARDDCDCEIPKDFDSSYFGDKFIFGTATSAYQIEGGTGSETGRGPSVWDTFTHETPGTYLRVYIGLRMAKMETWLLISIIDLKNIANVKKMGFKAFRMSISWSRVIPTGSIRDGVNDQGIQFYRNVIKEIKENGLEPFVTIFHWDTPQALEDKYGGFLCRTIVDDYQDYADLLFKEFGENVTYWMTFNEPWALSGFAYDDGIFAPGRCSSWVNRKCRAGNSATEPYIVAHHLLLAHAAAQNQRGQIGITLFTFWFEPLSNRQVDIEASETALDFMFGLWMDPLTYGQYPRRVQNLVGDRLLKFTDNEIKLLKKSYDFIGLQYYTSYYAKPNAYSPWFYIFPKGIRRLLKYTKDTYDNPAIYITENGVDNNNNDTQPVDEALKDQFRINYYRNHTWNVFKSIKEDKVNVTGYFAWSYIDNFEWNIGYTSRFGLYYVDYKDNLKRYAKDSAIWFCQFINCLIPAVCDSLRPEQITQVTSRKLGKYYM